LSLQQAAAVGLTYLAAWLVSLEYAKLADGETLLVIVASGEVGGAAAQIGKWRGAWVLGVDQRPLSAEAPRGAGY
jgi:NADPH:quinone reductase